MGWQQQPAGILVRLTCGCVWNRVQPWAVTQLPPIESATRRDLSEYWTAASSSPQGSLLCSPHATSSVTVPRLSLTSCLISRCHCAFAATIIKLHVTPHLRGPFGWCHIFKAYVRKGIMWWTSTKKTSNLVRHRNGDQWPKQHPCSQQRESGGPHQTASPLLIQKPHRFIYLDFFKKHHKSLVKELTGHLMILRNYC